MVAKGHRYIRVTNRVRKAFILLAAEMQSNEGRTVSIGEATEQLIDQYLEKNQISLSRKKDVPETKTDNTQVYLNIPLDVAEAIVLYGKEISERGRLSYDQSIAHFLEKYCAELVELKNDG